MPVLFRAIGKLFMGYHTLLPRQLSVGNFAIWEIRDGQLSQKFCCHTLWYDKYLLLTGVGTELGYDTNGSAIYSAAASALKVAET